MIYFSPTIAGLIESSNTEVFYLVKLTNGDDSIYRALTTFNADVELSDGVNYLADDTLISVDLPQLSSTVDREQYKAMFADSNFVLMPEADASLTGKFFECRL